MIVFRYLSREVLLTLSAVSAVLLVIIMSGRFVKYLAQAAGDTNIALMKGIKAVFDPKMILNPGKIFPMP